MSKDKKVTYVKTQLTNTLLILMKSCKFEDITIRELCLKAGVGRASFYRNYTDKEDILKQESIRLIKRWGKEYENDPKSTPFNLFESLFNHYKSNGEFYQSLYKAGLSHLILDTIVEIIGAKPEMNNAEAYGKSFLAFGIYGWVNEWIKRGMQESGAELNTMLSQNQ